MSPTSAPAVPSTTIDKIHRYSGGGPRRIAESAGVVITHGDGAYLVDEAGRRYLDLATAMGVAAIGHGNPIWARAVSEQAARLAATVLHTPEHAAYLERLSTFLPAGLDHVALYSGGAEAVEVAIRLAQSATGRRNIISFTTGFHGKTAGTRYLGHRFPEEHHAMGVPWVHDVAYPTCTQHDAVSYSDCSDDGAASLTAVAQLAEQIGDVAAVIVEPVLGTAGNRPPERLFLAGLRKLCSDKGWLLIDDESITGVGRMGVPFASDYFDIRPDILVLGKAVGGGYPLSGVAAPGAVWNQSLYAEKSATSSSYGANPVACAAGVAVLDIVMADGFLENVTAMGQRLGQGLRQLATNSPYVANPRGAGAMLGFDLVDPNTGELANSELCLRLFRQCLDAGVLIVGDVPGVRVNPPLTLSLAEADAAISALEEGLCR